MPATRSVQVDPQLREAHALCVDLAPEVFDLGDDVASCDLTQDPMRFGEIDAAIAACPRQAISWVDSPLTTASRGPAT